MQGWAIWDYSSRQLGADISSLGIKGVGQASRLSYCPNLREYCYKSQSPNPQIPASQISQIPNPKSQIL
ncbi:hypothetical protein [Kamptonema formosum]|uniref:hypothetical protein n=1 Tax=Kamptonema formosum TaxID=331992 RepID=UPI00034CAF57|nr:hypothetical protein [Oscillatoria sp. PCC 10802]